MSQLPQQPATEITPQSEAMRHVPPLAWVQSKLEEYRERADTLYWAAFESGRAADPQALDAVAAEMRQVCRAVERLAEAARHGREVQVPEGLRTRLDHAFNVAKNGLAALSPGSFNRLPPCTSFRRSDGEVVFSALLLVGLSLRKLVPLVNRVYPDVYEMLLAKLVVLQHPVNEETARPIA